MDGILTHYPRFSTALHVLLGFFEGGFNVSRPFAPVSNQHTLISSQPACICLTSCWYKRYEVQRRLVIWFVFGSVVSRFTGTISYGLSLMEGKGGLRDWSWIFIISISGAITVAVAMPIFFFLAEFPEKAKWLSAEERAIIQVVPRSCTRLEGLCHLSLAYATYRNYLRLVLRFALYPCELWIQF